MAWFAQIHRKLNERYHVMTGRPHTKKKKLTTDWFARIHPNDETEHKIDDATALVRPQSVSYANTSRRF